MDSLLNSSLEQICSEGPNGLLLQTLSSRLHLSAHLHQPLWTSLLSIPSLNFLSQNQNATVSHLPSDSSIQSFHAALNLNLNLIADQPLLNSFLGLYDVRSSSDAMCAYQRRALERVAKAGSTGITQSQLSKELGIKGENFFYKLRRLECQGLVVKKCLDDTNLVCLNRYSKRLGLGIESERGEVSKCEGEESKDENFIAELPIEHQIYEMVNEAGARGVVVFKVAERLGIDRKENRKRIESLCSRFGMVMDKERCGKNQVYRVWAPGKRNAESASEILSGSECVGGSELTEGSVQKGDTVMGTDTNDVLSRMSPAAESARPRRGKYVLEPSQDKGDQLQSQGATSPFQKRKRFCEAASGEALKIDDVTEHQPGSNEDGEEGCAFSKSKSPRFLWTEEDDRQLVIQYVRRCATLGAKYHHRINWTSLKDLPAPPSTCKRRMSYLKISNRKFRMTLMKLCNMLSKRYAKILQKSQNRSLNQDDCGSLFQGSTEDGCNQNCPLSDDGTDLQEEPWDDFNDQDIKKMLEEILHYVRSTKSVASKTCGASCGEESDLNATSEEDAVIVNLYLSPLRFSPIFASHHFQLILARAAKFAHWLHKRDRDLLGRGIDLPIEIQCGDLFHLFARVSSGELSISPCLQDGVGEAEYMRGSKRKIGNEHLNAKRLKSLVAESEIISRREKGFPGLMVSVYRLASSKLDSEDLFKGEQLDGNYHDSSAQNQIRETLSPSILIPVAETYSESRGKGVFHPGNSDIGGAPDVNDVHHVNILHSPKEVAECPSGKLTNSVEGKDISPRGDLDDCSRFSSGNLCAPRLPWINVDGTINKTIYEGLSRRVFGIVMQNPGILEGEMICKMEALNRHSCKRLLADMIEAKHLHIREMRQATSIGPPAFLGTLSGCNPTKSKVVSRKHFFANSMSAFLL